MCWLINWQIRKFAAKRRDRTVGDTALQHAFRRLPAMYYVMIQIFKSVCADLGQKINRGAKLAKTRKIEATLLNL
jgi:hypothetical protein